jgi:hypothetical protein
LTFLESASLTLFYAAAEGYVGRDAIRVGFEDPFGGRVVGNVDIDVQDCVPSGTSALRVLRGRPLVIIPPLSFGKVVQDLSSAVLLMSLDDGDLHPEGVTLGWSESMLRYFLVVDTGNVPVGRYYLRLSLGNGEVAELQVEVGESE